MKRIFAMFTVISVLVVLTLSSAFAVEPTKDGIYEVPVQLRHAEKDSESMGNSYILHTAILEITNGTKYITMVSDSKVMNLEFSYYTDGSVSGNTQAAEKIENVKIGGKTYSVGYRFPLMGTGQLVGVKFKASIMPMSPSARVYVDYSNSVLISSYEETTVPTPTQNQNTPTTSKATEPASSSSVTSAPSLNTDNKVDTEAIDNTLPNSEKLSENYSLTENLTDTMDLSELEESESSTIATEENKSSAGIIAGIIVAVVIIAGAAAAIIIKTHIKK